jgi:hypothetical protein
MNTNFLFIDISPTNTSGFCNQLYSIAGSCSHLVNHNPSNTTKVIFIGKYLMEVNSKKFCNIGEIIDLNASNIFLKKYNIILFDMFNFDFKIVKIKYGLNNYSYDITYEIVNQSLKNNIFKIGKDINLNNIKGDPIEYYKKTFCIPFNKNQSKKIYITYLINGIIFNEVLNELDGYLKNDFLLDFTQEKKICPVHNDGSFIFSDILRNIVFNNVYIEKANEFIKTNISINNNNINNNTNKKINCIHLRLEDDAIDHWSKSNKIDFNTYKTLLENKYIYFIQKYIDKHIPTIILAHNYENNVIKYLTENDYNYITTPNFHPDRDVSAIIDLHIGQICNNICICVFESTFSFALVTRAYNIAEIKNYLICFTDINNNNEIHFANKFIT